MIIKWSITYDGITTPVQKMPKYLVSCQTHLAKKEMYFFCQAIEKIVKDVRLWKMIWKPLRRDRKVLEAPHSGKGLAPLGPAPVGCRSVLTDWRLRVKFEDVEPNSGIMKGSLQTFKQVETGQFNKRYKMLPESKRWKK
jgi:hypothetical protein